MFQKWKTRVRHWVADALARLFNCICDPNAERECVALEDYLRIQNLRRLEEERYRAIYRGPRI